MIDKIKYFFKEYGTTITGIGAVLLIINQVGFSINVPQYYNSLSIEGKILFIGLINFLITVFFFTLLINKINRIMKK